MIIYQIRCSGICTLGSKESLYSRKVYKSCPNEDQIEEFKLKCCDPNHIISFDINDDITVSILKLELQD